MAEPARNLGETPSEVYDEPSVAAPSDPKANLKVLEGGGKTTEPKRGHLKEAGDEAPSRDELSDAEQTADAGQEHDQTVGSGYRTADATKRRLSLKNYSARKKAGIGGGILAIIISVIGLFIASGPLEFIHLSQILQRNFFGNNNTITIRNKGLLRYARTGNAEETRLGKLGSTVYNRTLSQLKDQGIEFNRNVRGVPDSMTIDTSKNDNYKDLSPAAREDAIIRDYKITDPAIISETGHLGSGLFKIDLTNTTLKGIDFVNATAKTAIGSLANGKVETGLATRYVKRAWDLPRLFSPLDKLKSAAQNKFASALAEKTKAQQLDEERVAALESAVTETPEVLDARSKVKGALDENASKLNAVLFVQAGICALRSAADAAVTLNRGLIVLPATVQATDKIAIGSQVQSGQNFDLTQLGAVSDSFQNANGHSIWEARALKATEGTSSPSGLDLPVDYAQAFSGKTTADEIRNEIQFKVLGVDVTGAACSPVGLAAGLIVGIAAIITSIPSDGATGAGYAAWAATQISSAIAVGGLFYMFQTHLTELLQNKAIVPPVLSGPLGGNLMAYGARELSNVESRSMGGIALDNTQSTVLTQAEEQQYRQEFQSEPIAKRLFNAYDSRSVVSKLIDNTSPNLTDNLSKVGSIFTNFGSLGASTFSAILPHAAAANTPYNWGFPKYGIPQSLAENENYEDPYANGDAVAQMLDQAGCATDNSCSWRSRALACFGVDINKDSGQWSVIAQKDVNPGSDSYSGGNCSDTSDSWNRLRLFVFDSRLMDTVACHQGTDEQSCENIGMGNSIGSASPSQTPASGSLPAGDSRTLAGQLMQYVNNGKIRCTTSGCPDIANTASGTSIKGGQGCLVDALQPGLLGMLLELVQMGHTFTLSALCSDHHNDGLAGHAGGRAADFNTIDGTFMGPNDTPWSQPKIDAARKLDQDIASFMPNSTGFGQVQCHPAFDFLSSFNNFSDACHHQHVQVET